MSELTKQIESLDQKFEELRKKLADPATVKDTDREVAAVKDLQKRYDKALWLANLDAEGKQAEENTLESNPQEVFSKRYSPDSEEHEFQKACDSIYLTSRLLRVYPRDLKNWAPFEKRFSKFVKAMDTATAGEGTEWFPTEMSARLTQLVELDLKVAKLFPEITMPRKSFELPTMTAFVTARKLSETLVDVENATSITVAEPTSSKATLSAKKLGIRMNWSMELEEETIFPLIPVLEGDAAKSIVRAIETAIINGDTSVTHQDSGISGDNAQTIWTGLRKKTQSSNKFDLSTMSVNNLLQLVAAIGKYGAEWTENAFITSPAGIVQLMKLQDAAGRQALIQPMVGEMFGLKGNINTMFGRPVIISEHVKTTLNANGVVGTTPGGNKTQIILVHRPSFVLGNRRQIRVGTRVWIDTDQRIIVSTWRGDWVGYFDPTVEKNVALGNNVSIT